MTYTWCRFCHLPLTDPDSRTVGYGEDCARQRGLPHGLVRTQHDPDQDTLFDQEPAR